MPIPSAAMIFEYLRPRSLASPQEVTEYLVLHQSAQHFRLEVEHRENLKAYCQSSNSHSMFRIVPSIKPKIRQTIA